MLLLLSYLLLESWALIAAYHLSNQGTDSDVARENGKIKPITRATRMSLMAPACTCLLVKLCLNQFWMNLESPLQVCCRKFSPSHRSQALVRNFVNGRQRRAHGEATFWYSPALGRFFPCIPGCCWMGFSPVTFSLFKSLTFNGGLVHRFLGSTTLLAPTKTWVSGQMARCFAGQCLPFSLQSLKLPGQAIFSFGPQWLLKQTYFTLLRCPAGT